MTNVTGKNGKLYINTIAENYLCVPAVMETIIRADNYTSINKYDIANYLGIVLPNGISYPQINNFTISNDSKELGVKLKQNTINDLFTHFGIALHENYESISLFDRDFFADSLADLLSKGMHIVCGFDYNFLYNLGDEYVGHVSIVLDSNPANDEVFLLDPGPKGHGIKRVNALSLYSAINKAKDGLWLIKKVK